MNNNEIQNNFEALAVLWSIMSDIDNLLDSLDEDLEKDRPELFTQFKALGTYLSKS